MSGSLGREASAPPPSGSGQPAYGWARPGAPEAWWGQETPFQALLDGAPDAVVMCDLDGRILLVNRQTEALFGYRREELLGRPVEQLVPGSARARHPTHRARYVADPRTRPMGANLDLMARRKDGSEFPVDIALSSFTTDDDRVIVTASVRDVTDRTELERALRHSREEAVAANVAKSEFLSRMSHELRTPLNAVLGFAQLLELDQLSVEQQEAVAQISRAGRHLLDLINEVLDISRIEAGQLTLSREPVLLRQVIQETVPLIRPLAAARRITLAHPDLGRCGYYVMADHQRLKQVLLNLLSNAVKYNRDGGRVDLDWGPVEPEERPAERAGDRGQAATHGRVAGGIPAARGHTPRADDAAPDGPVRPGEVGTDGSGEVGTDGPGGRAGTDRPGEVDGEGGSPGHGDGGTDGGPEPGAGRIRVYVRDTGPGIAEEYLPRLFTPFDRLGAEHLDVDGSGVGLALSLKLVEAMGGRLEVDSHAGRGSTFSVLLQAAEEIEPEDALPTPAAGGHRAARVVLYVEDNLSNLRLMERVVALRPSWRLVHALHGGLAVELARSQHADLVLLDLHLPDIHGAEVLRRLRADVLTRRVPVCVVSADATRSQRQRLLEAGADAYLTKPIDVAEVLAMLDRVDTEAEEEAAAAAPDPGGDADPGRAEG